MTPDLTEGVKWYLAFVISTTVHEASHAWTALKLGDDTAYRGGQVTLDPTPHIQRSPIGMVVVPIVSYLLGGWMMGWASAPYDPQWAIQYPRRSALMALAGPASNFAIVIIAALLIRAGLAAHVFDAPSRITMTRVTEPAVPGLWFFASSMLSIFFSLNLLLGVFNLIPLPPLDGAGIFMFFCNSETAARYFEAVYGSGIRMIGVVVAWYVMDAVMRPIHLFAVNLLYPGAGYH